jgi:hypothetical protein
VNNDVVEETKGKKDIVDITYSVDNRSLTNVKRQENKTSQGDMNFCLTVLPLTVGLCVGGA